MIKLNMWDMDLADIGKLNSFLERSDFIWHIYVVLIVVMKRQKIVYGIPKMTTQLQKDIDNHKIYLVRGKKMPPPRWYCFHCHKDVCYSFLPIDETSTTSVESEVGGFYEGYQKIVVKKIKDRFVDSYSDSIGTLECETSIDLTEKEYKKFIHNIYPTLKNGMKTMMI